MVRRLEHGLQTAVAVFLARVLPPDIWWTSVDAGQGKMGAIAAERRKARGVKAGVPDILLLFQGKFRTVELKIGEGEPSEAQRKMAGEIVTAGGGYCVCRSVGEVERVLRGWEIPLRGTSLTAAERDGRLALRASKPAKAPRIRPKAPEVTRRGLSAMARARRAGVFA